MARDGSARALDEGATSQEEEMARICEAMLRVLLLLTPQHVQPRGP